MTETSVKKKKMNIMGQLKDDLKDCNKHPVTKSRYYLSVPLETSHNHITDVSRLTQVVNPLLVERINELVAQGFINTKEIIMHLRHYVTRELFKDNPVKPEKSDCSFYPTAKDVENHVYMLMGKEKYSNVDHDELQWRINEWRADEPSEDFSIELLKDKFRNLLKELNDLSYQCSDLQTMKEEIEILETTKENILKHLDVDKDTEVNTSSLESQDIYKGLILKKLVNN